ncbi:uncharacterized protein SPAR_P00770 [Saccharomyces paradoxus]|uniref:Uncharacterized protein n=1 Tax=Saccharomyces paradoxus TaxID=27291 RepID=A0A8B8V0N1_SACPA|nr:uncharacterized protein SPAR_P00770 [Saccharomyces paradoxus]QHS76542.1 hypothetical protein SPAR_P00770 [Saccharomyces paradoxus]
MRSLLSAHTSSKPTTSCGHSSCPTHLVVGVSQESSSTLSKVVLSVTVKNSSTNWLRP